MDRGRLLISLATFYRTYSRPAGERMMTLEEVAQAVGEYSAWLGPTEPGEAEALAKLIAARKAFPAGRTLWIAPTEYARRHAEANYNCAFHRIRSPKDFADLQLLLMSGAGVGNRFTADDIEHLDRNIPLPPRLSVRVIEGPFVGFSSPAYQEVTTVRLSEERARIRVGDSREGWADAIAAFMELLGEGVTEIEVDLTSVRPLGSPLRTFGGFASGPGPLAEMYRALPDILLREPVGRWTPSKVLDVVNLIGRATVAGGTRRSAEIALSDNVPDFADAKVGSWWERYPWRSQSNNSVVFSERPDLDAIQQILERVLEYGEPGFVNEAAGRMRRPDFEGVNPCAEILLRDHGVCNLATLVLPHLAGPGEMEHAARLLTRHAIRITLASFHPYLGEWERVQREDRLIGISFTGLMDWIAARKLSMEEALGVLGRIRSVIHDEARRYSRFLGIPEPILKTTVKPEGTLSLVAGAVSPGMHDAYAPYYIRRVRMSRHDPVAQALWLAGMEPKPELGYSTPEEAPVWVYEFPIRSPAPYTAQEVPALEQLERYRGIMRAYADHNVSCTIYISPEEVGEVARWLYQNWDDVVAVSFLPRSAGGYQLAPLEAIGRQVWEEMEASLPDPAALPRYLGAVLEAGEYQSDDPTSDCEGGACPVR